MTPARQAFLNEIIAAVEKKRVLAVLTGGNGSGKSSFCRLLAANPADGCITVLVTNPVGSFDDLVQEIVRAVDANFPETESRAAAAPGTPQSPSHDSITDLRRRLLYLNDHGKRLFVVIDRAERMFLATMERLQELVKISLAEKHVLSLLLVGNEDLLDSLSQISLTPLNSAVQARHVMPDMLPEEQEDFFCPDLPKTKNIVKKVGAGQFLSQHFIEKFKKKGKGGGSNIIRMPRKKKEKKERVAPLMERPAAKKRDLSFLSTAKLWEKIRLLAHEPWLYLLLATPVACILLLFSLSTSLNVGKKTVATGDAVSPLATEHREPDPAIVPAAPAEQTINSADAARYQAPVVQPPAKRLGTAQQEERQKTKETAAGAGAAKNTQARTQVPTLEPKGSSQKVTIAALQTPQDAPLIKARVGTTRRWARRADRAGYTIQLMVLQADSARMSLEQDLNHPAVRPLIKQIYIFEKKGPPSSLFVFLGEYQSRKEALAAKAALPTILARNKPYLLSVEKALDKAR